MAACSFTYADPHAPCTHAVAPDSTLCLWHNVHIVKSDPYVRDLLKRADSATQGDLAGFHLAGMQWPNVHLPLRNLSFTDLRDTNFDGADLSGSDLSGANLKRASLKRVDLRGAQLTGVDLSGTNLTDADLRDVDLSGAHLAGTILNGCDLRGANLAGAHIVDFSWNRRTRFAGVKGLEAQSASNDGDATQAFPAPLAMANYNHDDISLLKEPTADGEKTHVYAPAVAGFLTPVQGHAPTGTATAAQAINNTMSWRWRSAVAASLVFAVGGVGCGWWGWQHGKEQSSIRAPGTDQVLLVEVDNLQQQHEADLQEIMRLQEKLRTASDTASKAKQDVAVANAQAESMRNALRASETDLMRMHAADDRATVLEQKLAKLLTLNTELAKHSAREEDIGRILVKGVDRLKDENQSLATERDQLAIDRTHLATIEADLKKTRRDYDQLSHERDQLLAANQQLTSDLVSASKDIERYLDSVNATHLQDYLTDTNKNIPLLTIQPGKPIALTGDYLLTLRVDHGTQPGTVLTKVVVQRPSSATNPDITVILYDDKHQPLRRLAYSFPHVDTGKPFVSSATEVACERFPAYARVHVTPGLDGLSAQR